MSPKLTGKMLREARKTGAQIAQKRKVQRSEARRAAPEPEPKPKIVDNSAEVTALREEIAVLKQALESEKKASDKRSQELVAMLSGLGENKPMRLKPIRDMDRNSPTYLLVSHYDFVPVRYQTRKLDS